MGDMKVTKMVLKVELSCSKCSKKVKKVLGKFPEIQEQSFDERKNTVTIKVVSNSPEKIRDELCCKGDGSIKTIEILKPPPPPPPPDPQPTPPKHKSQTTTTTKSEAEAEAKAAAGAAAGVHVNVINSVGACWCYGRPVHCSCGCGNRVCYIGRCSDYICEANPAAPCTIM